MRIFVAVLLLLGAQFCLTAFAPTPAGKAWILWPFAEDSKPILNGVGGLPKQPGSLLTVLLAGVAGVGFLAAALGVFWTGIPADLWRPLVIVSAVASVLLHMLYFNLLALPPIVVDAILFWGVLIQNWSVIELRSS